MFLFCFYLLGFASLARSAPLSDQLTADQANSMLKSNLVDTLQSMLAFLKSNPTTNANAQLKLNENANNNVNMPMNQEMVRAQQLENAEPKFQNRACILHFGYLYSI
jgi:hypothetical protein